MPSTLGCGDLVGLNPGDLPSNYGEAGEIGLQTHPAYSACYVKTSNPSTSICCDLLYVIMTSLFHSVVSPTPTPPKCTSAQLSRLYARS